MGHSYNIIEVVFFTIGGLYIFGFMTAVTTKKTSEYLKKSTDLLKVFKGQWKVALGLLIGYLSMRGLRPEPMNATLILIMILGLYGIAFGISRIAQKHDEFWDGTKSWLKKNWVLFLGLALGLYLSTITFTFTSP